ncbi:MAG: thioredoxin family protein [Chloroflexi bacterium]|nr:thioredoxin family protein [Chloroflexota bacterium]
MPMLTPELRAQLQQILVERMADPVQVDLFTRQQSSLFVPGQPDCQYCDETRELLEEVAELTDKIQLRVHDVAAEREMAQEMANGRIPAIVIQGHNAGQIRYFGIPAGYEFSTLIEDVIDSSTGQVILSQRSQEALAAVDQDLHIQVFVTPT